LHILERILYVYLTFLDKKFAPLARPLDISKFRPFELSNYFSYRGSLIDWTRFYRLSISKYETSKIWTRVLGPLSYEAICFHLTIVKLVVFIYFDAKYY